jgi:hypothetical protein
VGVIQFPQWPIYCYVDGNEVNTITQWLDDNGVSVALRSALQVQIDMVKFGGPEMVPGSIVGCAEFEAFKGVRKGENPVYLVFRRGVYTQREITLLACSRTPKDRDALALARHNLRELERDRRRRRYERLTRRRTT